MKQYLDYLQHIYDHGACREDRTGVGTIGVFGYQMRFDYQKGFPLVTTKKDPSAVGVSTNCSGFYEARRTSNI